MTDIVIDQTTGDVVIDNGVIRLHTDPVEALRQRLYIRLNTFKGEWFLNQNKGVPYFQTIFKKGTGKDLVDSIYRSYILKTDGVIRITNFESTFNPEQRKYSLTFTVTTNNNQTLTVTDFEVV